MKAQIIDGKKLAANILEEIKAEVETKKLNLKLGIIQIGNDKASELYIKYKSMRAGEVGIKTEHKHFAPEPKAQKLIVDTIKTWNEDASMTGFYIQTPVDDAINLSEIIKSIDPKKDVDGMTPYNLGGLFQNRRDTFVSATAVACYKTLKSVEAYELSGKHAVIVGRSAIVGKPLAALLLNEDCTVTLCHSKTQNLAALCKTADILVSCTGVSNLVTEDFVKEGAFVIDCGAPKAEVSQNAQNKASYITPVPGGIGPITIASLLKNVLKTVSIK